MKKIVLGVCGVLVFIGGLASIRSGVLKAGELTKDSSLIVETGTVESVVTIPESSETPDEEVIVPEAESPAPVEEQPAQPIEEPSTLPEPSASSESVPSSSKPSDTSPTESSTVDSSTSISSTSTSTTNSTSSSTSTSSTTMPSSSTKPSSTNPSNPKPSQTKPSETTPSSIEPTQPSTSQSSKQPTKPMKPTPVSPTTQPAPASTNNTSVQSNSFVAPSAPEAFSETSTLNLPSELKTTEVAQSDLKGFELPLLSSFENEDHAVLIYEGIKQLGNEQEETYSAEQLATEIYQNLFDLEISGKPEKMPEEITVGSLIYQKKKDKNSVLGIYIGNDYYLTVDDVEVEEDTKERTSINEESEEKEKKVTQRQVILETLDLEEELLVQELPETALTEYGKQVLAEYPASMNFTENESAKKFIETIAEDAQKLGQEYDVFASVMIAQALLESGSGTSTLSLSPNFNLFGIKGTYQGQSVSMSTQEDRGNGDLYSINSAFRKYPNYAASLGDYVQLIRGGISGNDGYYRQTWRSEAKNYLRTTNALTGTYATDTTYGLSLIHI